MQDLHEQLLQERLLRDAEKKAAENIVRKLSTQISIQQQQPMTPPRASQQSSGHGRPTSPRSGGGDKPFFTPVSSARKVLRTKSPVSTPRGRAAVNSPPPVPEEASRSAALVDNTSHPTSEAVTALQYAWKKFCRHAADDFTPHELALVSVTTLGQLLDRYNVRDEVERAQIEAQWSLLQRHETDVGPDATRYVPHSSAGSSRRGVTSPGRSPRPFLSKEAEQEHIMRLEQEFDLRPTLAQPRLSHRVALEGAGIRPSNPNDIQSASPLYQPLRKTPPRTHSPAVSSNPNAPLSPTSNRKLCFQRAEADPLPVRTAIGKGRADPPMARDAAPSGIRTAGNTHQSTYTAPARGLRVNIGPRERAMDCLDDYRRSSGGVRTFAAAFGRCEEPRPNLIVRSPNFARQSSLSTATLASGARRPASPTLSERQQRTPFAVDA